VGVVVNAEDAELVARYEMGRGGEEGPIATRNADPKV
jgi:hypothetical protein